MTNPAITFRAAGECGWIIEFGDVVSEAASNAVLALDARLRDQQIPGVMETAPTIRSVLVRFDPLEIAPGDLKARLDDILAERDWWTAPPPADRRLWRIPAWYGGEAGPDLPNVADLMGLSEADAVQQHAGLRQRVLMLGFAPGFAYIGHLPDVWNLPRLEHVKPEVPPGSISVAVRQTVLCATPIPTGWRTIARTPFLSFAPAAEVPFLLEPGDEIVFEPVTEVDYLRLADRAANGEAIVQAEAVK